MVAKSGATAIHTNSFQWNPGCSSVYNSSLGYNSTFVGSLLVLHYLLTLFHSAHLFQRVARDSPKYLDFAGRHGRHFWIALLCT